jgi:2-phospho-L-lactate guanylyltransferase
MSQGSVHTFEPSTGAGSVLLDDGAEVQFPAQAFAASGLRLLRPGQRVSLERGADGVVSRIFIRGIGEGESIR